MCARAAYPPRLRASGEAQGEPGSVPSCLGTNKLSDTVVDRLMLHLYSISTTGEESVVLCPNHNNKVSLNDGSLRAEGQNYQLTQLSQPLLESLRLLLPAFTENQSQIFCARCAKQYFIIQPALWLRDTVNDLYCSPKQKTR